MKTVLFAPLTAVLPAAASITPQAQAGDREWSVAGKVLTGIFAADVLFHW